MPHQNRVTPHAELIATPARGALMGNRGCLHNERAEIRRPFVGKRWIACLLEFRERRRAVMTPGCYTELFFLDEVTALAAGHRPCAECRRDDYNAFRWAWVAAGLPSRGALPSANEMDTRLHAELLTSTGGKATHSAHLADLPDGVFVVVDGNDQSFLFYADRFWPWTPGGYSTPCEPATNLFFRLFTPPSVAAVLAAGYTPMVHISTLNAQGRLPGPKEAGLPSNAPEGPFQGAFLPLDSPTTSRMYLASFDSAGSFARCGYDNR